MALRLRDINSVVASLENTHPQQAPPLRHTQRMTAYTLAVMQDLRGRRCY